VSRGSTGQVNMELHEPPPRVDRVLHNREGPPGIRSGDLEQVQRDMVTLYEVLKQAETEGGVAVSHFNDSGTVCDAFADLQVNT
jgi:hypothetical protein